MGQFSFSWSLWKEEKSKTVSEMKFYNFLRFLHTTNMYAYTLSPPRRLQINSHEFSPFSHTQIQTQSSCNEQNLFSCFSISLIFVLLYPDIFITRNISGWGKREKRGDFVKAMSLFQVTNDVIEMSALSSSRHKTRQTSDIQMLREAVDANKSAYLNTYDNEIANIINFAVGCVVCKMGSEWVVARKFSGLNAVKYCFTGVLKQSKSIWESARGELLKYWGKGESSNDAESTEIAAL